VVLTLILSIAHACSLAEGDQRPERDWLRLGEDYYGLTVSFLAQGHHPQRGCARAAICRR
jgi:hypothetical protein